MTPLLTVKNLKTQFLLGSTVVKAVDGVSYHINKNEVVALVGESGCGKSVSQLSVLQLIRPPGKVVDGEIIFNDKDLLKYDYNGEEIRKIRGKEIGIIFQEPMTSLNPVLSISSQLTEVMKVHTDMVGE